MNVRELRRKYIEFFLSKGHQQHASGSLIPYDVTGKLDESLLFNGAGMVQFKPYFRGIAEPPSKRLTNAQKVVRTGDIESVGNLSHLTFFEMLGNFSFGDYFKKEAIAFSWEFLTSPQWLGLDPKRLSFTVFEEDDEAYGCWSEHLRSVGIDPAYRVFRLGEETNYWPAGAFSSGPPGPCGPNSEMFYWVADSPPPLHESPDSRGGGQGGGETYTREDWLRDDEAKNWLEIWNDVFIQYEWKGRHKDPARPNLGYEKEGMDNLPFQSVDTGMGLERTAAVLGGLASVYDTDSFAPVIRRIEEVSRTSPPIVYGSDPTRDTAIRVIADHIRTACFCIADGILPSNTGRGYVLRRLIRRAVLKGQRVLGFEELFLFHVFDGVVEALGDHYSELTERREVIVETLKNEEALFRRTLRAGVLEFWKGVTGGICDLVRDHGLWKNPEGFRLKQTIELLRVLAVSGNSLSDSGRYLEGLSYIAQLPESEKIALVGDLLGSGDGPHKFILRGEDVFNLYDTFGFPLEVTQELAAEAGLEVDLDGYEAALKEAQERSRGSSDMEAVYAADDRLVVAAPSAAETRFVGYSEIESEANIVRVSPVFGPDHRTTGELLVALDQTPFYAESGGQVGDTGAIETSTGTLAVRNTRKEGGIFWHECGVDVSWKGLTREEVQSRLEQGELFHAVTAKVDGSRRRRITRHHSATHLLHHALRKVLGKHVTQAGSLVHPDHLRFDFTHGKAMTPDEIVQVERLVNEMALSGDDVAIKPDVPIAEAKQMGAMALFGEKYGDSVRVVRMGDSIELCGGCHVRHTSEVGLFKITSESSAASGVRRIEAVAGEAAYDWATKMDSQAKEVADILKASPTTLLPAVQRTLEQLREEKKRLERLRTQSAQGSAQDTVQVGPVEIVRTTLTEGETKDATLVADRLVESAPNRVALVALVVDGKATFVCKAGEQAVKAGAHAGKLVGEVAKVAGGGGGGRSDFATAGAKQPEKAAEALSAAEAFLKAQLQV